MQDGPLRATLIDCCTYHTMMKLITVAPSLNKIQKVYKLRDTPLSSADISIFLQVLAIFVILGNKEKKHFSI